MLLTALFPQRFRAQRFWVSGESLFGCLLKVSGLGRTVYRVLGLWVWVSGLGSFEIKAWLFQECYPDPSCSSSETPIPLN